MKIFEITEASKYATDDGPMSGDERLKRVQQMDRAGVDTSTASRDLGRAGFSGIDPEDLQGKKIRRQGQSDLEKATATRDRKERQRAAAEKRKEKLKQDRKDREKQKERDKRIRSQRNKKARQDRYDKAQGFRKDAAGRTLRDPRYYRNKKTKTGRDPNASALRRGIDDLVYDPYNTISDFYNDRVSRIKDFLKQEF